MEWFFEEWVRGTGIPHYRVEFTAHHTEKGYVLRGKLFQTGVPRSFVASVPLYASGAGHSALLGTVVAAGEETSFHFVAPNLPRKIVIDPQMTLLCTSAYLSLLSAWHVAALPLLQLSAIFNLEFQSGLVSKGLESAVRAYLKRASNNWCSRSGRSRFSSAFPPSPKM